jgi:CheY-like chemotaxis protein
MVLVAHESESIREVIRRLLDGAGYGVSTVADGRAALAALALPPDALVLDVALPEVHAYAVVEEVRRLAPGCGIVLVASVYNRTGYKRRPTSLYGADDYVEQHHIPDALVNKLQKLIGPPPRAPRLAPARPHEETLEGQIIRDAGQERLGTPSPPTAPTPQAVQRAERLAWLIVADIALYNGDAIDQADHAEALESRLRVDLDEGRLLFDLRVPEEVRRTRDFVGEALEQIRAQRRAKKGA